jgi:hypothetical protein
MEPGSGSRIVTHADRNGLRRRLTHDWPATGPLETDMHSILTAPKITAQPVDTESVEVLFAAYMVSNDRADLAQLAREIRSRLARRIAAREAELAQDGRAAPHAPEARVIIRQNAHAVH